MSNAEWQRFEEVYGYGYGSQILLKVTHLVTHNENLWSSTEFGLKGPTNLTPYAQAAGFG